MRRILTRYHHHPDNSMRKLHVATNGGIELNELLVRLYLNSIEKMKIHTYLWHQVELNVLKYPRSNSSRSSMRSWQIQQNTHIWYSQKLHSTTSPSAARWVNIFSLPLHTTHNYSTSIIFFPCRTRCFLLITTQSSLAQRDVNCCLYMRETEREKACVLLRLLPL